MFRAVSLLFAAQVFVTCLADSQKVSIKVAFFLFRRSNPRPNESRPPFCNFGTGLRVIHYMVPRCFAAVMATIMQRFLLWQAIAKWRQQGHPRIWEDVLPGCLAGQAQWFQDLIHELIMCVVRGWACEFRCGHDDGHVGVALFPLFTCV